MLRALTKLLLHASAKKKTKRFKRFKLALLLVVFKSHRGSERVKSNRRKVLAGSPTLTLPFWHWRAVSSVFAGGSARTSCWFLSFLPDSSGTWKRRTGACSRNVWHRKWAQRWTTLPTTAVTNRWVVSLGPWWVSQHSCIQRVCEASDQTKTNNSKHQPKRCPLIQFRKH